MRIAVNMSSMIPIYEQIMECVKRMITAGELTDGDALPSVRALARELSISALTVKKAYDRLEEEGFTETIHGKGTQVKCGNRQQLKERQLREVELDLERAVDRARAYGLEAEEVRQLLELVLEG